MLCLINVEEVMKTFSAFFVISHICPKESIYFTAKVLVQLS